MKGVMTDVVSHGFDRVSRSFWRDVIKPQLVRGKRVEKDWEFVALFDF